MAVRTRRRRSLGGHTLTTVERLELAAIEAELAAEGGFPQHFPATVAACPPAGTPCRWLRCKHHLGTDLGPTGLVKINHRPDADGVVDLAGMRETCSLRVAAQGPRTLEATGRLLGLSLERTRQCEQDALANLKRRLLRDERMPPAVRKAIAELVSRAEAARAEAAE